MEKDGHGPDSVMHLGLKKVLAEAMPVARLGETSSRVWGFHLPPGGTLAHIDVPNAIICCSPYPLGPISVVAIASEYAVPGPLCQLSSAMALYQVSGTCIVGTHKYGALAQQYTVLEGGGCYTSLERCSNR